MCITKMEDLKRCSSACSCCCELMHSFQKHGTSKLIVGFLFVLFATFTSATTTTSCTIVLGNDGCTDAFYFLMLLLDLLCVCLGIGIYPRLSILQRVHDLLLFLGIQLLTETLVLTRSLNC